MSEQRIKTIKKDQRTQHLVSDSDSCATISANEGTSLKDRLDDALRRLAVVQRDLTAIRREMRENN
jgi:hypothetical protein